MAHYNPEQSSAHAWGGLIAGIADVIFIGTEAFKTAQFCYYGLAGNMEAQNSAGSYCVGVGLGITALTAYLHEHTTLLQDIRDVITRPNEG